MLTNRVRLVFVLLALTLLAGVFPVAAQQPNPPTIDTSCPYTLKAGVPFAWLRLAASSAAPYGPTLQPGQTVQSNTPPTLTWDGVQWWLYVWPNVANVHGYYWVELSSLEARCAQPTPPPGNSGAANWREGNVVRVKSNVAFVWFRAQPAPGNPPIHTAFSRAELVIMGGPSQDNFGQWWWLMRDPRYSVIGWVEQNSVDLLSGPAPTIPTNWQAGNTVRVRPTVPFSWLRALPASSAAPVYTVGSGQTLILQQGPLSDGAQSWWQVIIPYRAAIGWVEESSLELIGG